MTATLRQRLSGFLFIAAVLAATLGTFTLDFATPSDLALARVVDMGATADDLCSTPDPQGLIDALYQACAPTNDAPVLPLVLSGAFVLGLPTLLLWWPHPPRHGPTRAGQDRPAIRAPPVTPFS